MANAAPICQPLITAIQQTVVPYTERLADQRKKAQADIRLQLTSAQLLLFSAIYGEKESSLTLVMASSLRQAGLTGDHLNTLNSLVSANQHWHVIEGRLSPQETAGDIVSRLSETIHHLLQHTPHHHFVIPEAVLDHSFPSPDDYAAQQLSVHHHETMTLGRLVKALVARGYIRYAAAKERGSFSVRGENIDLVLPTGQHHTLTFHGSTIEQITQLSQNDARSAPRRQVIQSLAIPPVAFPAAEVPLRQVLQSATVLKPTSQADTLPAGIIYDALHTEHPFPLQPVALTDITQPTYIVYENHDRVANYLTEHTITPAAWCQSDAAGIPLCLQGEHFALLSESALFTAAAASKPRSAEQGRALVAELTPNKPAVHSDHGIGIFEGLQTRTIDSKPKEYLILRYAAGDTLSVPVEYAHKVTPYLGEKAPTIHRLGGTLWQKTRRQAQHDAEAFARELLELAGQRRSRQAQRYTIYPDIQESLARSFPYELTPDQEAALAAIEEDLQKEEPLDRVVVGDVGFGKTELALRAARHVVANDAQVALLAPTTLLVQQHADTARVRFPELANHIGVLSRFATPREQKQVREKIADGTLKLIIGTQALLSNATTWHHLGLVIIDEEQRFGVKHKEHFKKIRATVDFLSLSATPIPRTLSMALSGLKELSIITTPPVGRQEVITEVTRVNDTLLTKAIERELARGGQVYVVAPKVRSLGTLARDVRQLVPTARVAVAHGQLPAAELAHTMQQFDQGHVDVLISSSIIENGLDLPNANTIIVLQATHFGLSDLYQLRGRVGRRERQGYAYFVYNQTELTSIQRQRLTALTEASRLGSGWSLAQRDLEIRGAGNFLGAEQSGTVNQVGIQLYLDMVHDAIANQSEPTLRRHDVDIKLPLVALIPQHYIANDDARSRYYQQLGRAATTTELTTILNRLITNFGPLPPEVANLNLLLTLQHCAAAAGISHIASQQITPSDEDPYWRLTVTTRKVPETLQKLQPLGTWAVRNNTLTHNLNDITPAIVGQLIKALI